MSSKKIAVTHPGKLGDAIYALPTIRWLCQKHECKADFWTSSYCLPLKRFFEYQSCIDQFFVSPTYSIHHMNCGVQPWEVPVQNPLQYLHVYQLGYRTTPRNVRLSDFIAKSVEVPTGLPISYEYPDIEVDEGKFAVIAPRGHNVFTNCIKDAASIMPVVQVGGKGDRVGVIGKDLTGLDLLETTAWISKCALFIGNYSSQLVLAEGFKMPKLACRSRCPAKNEILYAILPPIQP